MAGKMNYSDLTKKTADYILDLGFYVYETPPPPAPEPAAAAVFTPGPSPDTGNGVRPMSVPAASPAPAPRATRDDLFFLQMLNFKKRTNLKRDIFCWLLLTLGLYFGQAISITDGFSFVLERIRTGAFLISMGLALALFGPFMRWISKKRFVSGLLKISLPFGFGVSGAVVSGKIYSLLGFY